MSSGEGDDVVQSSVEMAATYSGPLPPPEWFRQYEQVLPGIADRMMPSSRATYRTSTTRRRTTAGCRSGSCQRASRWPRGARWWPHCWDCRF